jgi:hypothetical protein
MRTEHVTTIAGDVKSGFRDGPARQAQFSGPNGVVVAPSGAIFVTEQVRRTVQRIVARCSLAGHLNRALRPVFLCSCVQDNCSIRRISGPRAGGGSGRVVRTVVSTGHADTPAPALAAFRVNSRTPSAASSSSSVVATPSVGMGPVQPSPPSLSSIWRADRCGSGGCQRTLSLRRWRWRQMDRGCLWPPPKTFTNLTRVPAIGRGPHRSAAGARAESVCLMGMAVDPVAGALLMTDYDLHCLL